MQRRGWFDQSIEVIPAVCALGAGPRCKEALARAGGSRKLVTAIDRDGTLAGPDVELVRQAVDAGGRVLAAGGIRSVADVEALAAAGAEAAIVGRALLA